jgi:outer membrane autotransporter protein
VDGLMLAYNSSDLSSLLTAKRKAAPETKWGLYLTPSLILGSQNSTDQQTGFNFNIAGFTAGADYRVRDDLLVGLATGYSHTSADFRGSGGNLETNTWPISVYAAYLPESFYAFGSLGYALNLFNQEREISFPGLSRQPQGSPTGHQFNLYGEAGYDLKVKRFVVTPVASLSYSRLWIDGFTESGAGALDLKVSSQNAESLQTGVGAKIAVPLHRGPTVVVPQFYATYQHEFADNSRGLDARLSQGGSTFTYQTVEPQRDFAVLGANVTIITKKNFTLQLNYNAEVGRGNYTAHYMSAGLRWEF